MNGSEGRPEMGIGWHWPHWVPVELVVGIILSVVLALVVALAGGALSARHEPAVRTMVVPDAREETEDLDPRDPLVLCTQFVTHTQCAREET